METIEIYQNIKKNNEVSTYDPWRKSFTLGNNVYKFSEFTAFELLNLFELSYKQDLKPNIKKLEERIKLEKYFHSKDFSYKEFADCPMRYISLKMKELNEEERMKLLDKSLLIFKKYYLNNKDFLKEKELIKMTRFQLAYIYKLRKSKLRKSNVVEM